MKDRRTDIAYYLLLGLLYPLALLPLPVLYVLADVLFVLIYHVVRYRRRMVTKNLAACFPDKTEAERRAICRQFYRNFADYIVETVKLLHISDKEVERRFTWSGLEHITGPLDEGRSVTAYFAHCGNWEWAPSVTLHCKREVEQGDLFCQIYRPLRNKAFDRLMLKVRSRFGSISIPKNSALRKFVEMRRQGIASVTGFMSDQKPSHGDAGHLVSFLGRPTLAITGTETLARRLGMTVVYWHTSKPGRGHYHVDVVPMADNAADMPEHALTELYYRLLEKNILENPAIWLWSHNRWKHKIPQDTANVTANQHN